MITPRELSQTPGACFALLHPDEEENDWPYTRWSQTRDSDAMDRSNFAHVVSVLEATDREGYCVTHERHWACGWVETVLVKPGSAAEVASNALVAQYERYCVLDETAYYEMEWAENHPSERECYAEDCHCRAARYQHLLALVRGQA